MHVVSLHAWHDTSVRRYRPAQNCNASLLYFYSTQSDKNLTCSCLSNRWHWNFTVRRRNCIRCGDFRDFFCALIRNLFCKHFTLWNTHTHTLLDNDSSEQRGSYIFFTENKKLIWPFWFSHSALVLAGSLAHIGVSFLVDEEIHLECSISHVFPSGQQCCLSSQHTACLDNRDTRTLRTTQDKNP